jgi:DNA gyrase subunit A
VARTGNGRGVLVSAIVTTEGDEILVIMASGRVMRSRVADVRVSGRDTMGVILTRTGREDSVIAAALNREAAAAGVGSEEGPVPSDGIGSGPAPAGADGNGGPGSVEDPGEGGDG